MAVTAAFATPVPTIILGAPLEIDFKFSFLKKMFSSLSDEMMAGDDAVV